MRLVAEPSGRIEGGEILYKGRDLLKLSEEEMRAVRGRDIAMIFRAPPGERGQARRRRTEKQKTPALFRARGFLFEDGLAVTYFRVRNRHTIIGANSFHGPVRDGKAWFQAAIAAR